LDSKSAGHRFYRISVALWTGCILRERPFHKKIGRLFHAIDPIIYTPAHIIHLLEKTSHWRIPIHPVQHRIHIVFPDIWVSFNLFIFDFPGGSGWDTLHRS
jgi:hypothetical protein